MTIPPRLGNILGCIFVLCLGISTPAHAGQHATRKSPKSGVPSITAGPTGPIPQIPLDSIPALPPDVTYRDGKLTVVAPNSTLSDILTAIQKQTGAEFVIPAAPDRVAARLGPGSAADVLSALLTGSGFNFILLYSPTDASLLKRVVLLARPKADNVDQRSVATQNGPAGQAAGTNHPAQDQSEEPQGFLETPDEL